MCSMLQQVQEDSRPLLAAERLRCWFAAETARETSQHHDAPTGPALQAGPVPLDALAQRLGVHVATFSPASRPGVQGYLEPGENIIFLSAGQPEAIRRFTLAHELGHAALHRAWGLAAAIANGLADDHTAPLPAGLNAAPSPDAAPADGCGDSALDAPLDLASAQDETLRPGQAYSAAGRRESEANAFAAALLLPTGALLTAYFSPPPTQRRHGTDRVRWLSATFGVTEDTVLRRLVEALVDLPTIQALLRSSAETTPATVAAPSAPVRLDEEQAQAAQAPTPALVIAGPGAGKTSALLGRIVHLVQARHAPPAGVLALTFSHRAARELHDRLALALPGDAATGGAVDSPTVNTIHGFCGEVLRLYGPLVGLRADYRLVNEVEGYLLLRELARELPLVHYQPLAAPTLYYADLLGAISRAKDELADPARYQALATAMLRAAQTPEERLDAERADEIASVYAAYQAALAARGDPDFGDIIRLTVQLLREQPEVLAELRGRYQHILVDEFQDINRAMGVLLQTLAGPHGPIWAVGDADQAIYRFRGAAPANLTRFTRDYADAQVVTLRRNYRSLPPILEAAASVAQDFLAVAYASDPLGNGAAQANRPVSVGATLVATRAPADATQARPVVTLAVAPDEAAETAGLVGDIQRRLAAGQAPGAIAVLCRTRRQVGRVVAALRRAGVATQAPMPLFDQPLVKDILATLALLADTTGAGLLRAGALPDHVFTRADALAVLRVARTQHLTPTAALRSLPTQPQRSDGARGAERANVADGRDAEPGADGRLDTLPDLTPEGRAGLRRLSDILSELRRAPNVATGLARYVFNQTNLGARLLAQTLPDVADAAGANEDAAPDDAARRQALFVGRLLLLARAYDTQRAAEAQRALGSAASAPAVADWGGFLDYIRTLIALGQTGGADDPLAAEAVRVLTVHGSKGLEFPVVYLPGLANRRFPMQRQRDVTPMPIGLTEDAAPTPSPSPAAAGEGSLAAPQAPRDSPTRAFPSLRREGEDAVATADTHLLEEACLFYVAITRARDELVLSYARRYGRAAYHPSPFLLPIERRLAARLARVSWRAEQAVEPFTSVQLDGEQQAPGLPSAPLGDAPVAPSSERVGAEDAQGAEQSAPLTISALETYLRCPQQYAYRYLYGLGGQHLGMASLRQGLRETLLALHERFDAALADGEEARLAATAVMMAARASATADDGRADDVTASAQPAKRRHAHAAAPTPTAAYVQATLPSLDEARDLFDERWRQALGDTPHETTANDPAAAPDPLYPIYQRQGRRIAARLWDDLMRQRGLSPAGAAPNTSRAPHDHDENAEAPTAAPGALAATDGLRRGDMRVMTIRMGEQDVAGALDHVEGLATPDPEASDVVAPAVAPSGPVRFVRYRASGATDDPTLSDLFYTLAAQQIAGELGAVGAVEARHYSLATGESAAITLTPRQRERLERDLDAALAGLERGDFAPKPEPRRCQSCPYLLICPA